MCLCGMQNTFAEPLPAFSKKPTPLDEPLTADSNVSIATLSRHLTEPTEIAEPLQDFIHIDVLQPELACSKSPV